MQDSQQAAAVHAVAFDPHLAGLHRLGNTQVALDQRAKCVGVHVEHGRAPRGHAVVNGHQPPVANRELPLAAAGTVHLHAQVRDPRIVFGQFTLTADAEHRM